MKLITLAAFAALSAPAFASDIDPKIHENYEKAVTTFVKAKAIGEKCDVRFSTAGSSFIIDVFGRIDGYHFLEVQADINQRFKELMTTYTPACSHDDITFMLKSYDRVELYVDDAKWRAGREWPRPYS